MTIRDDMLAYLDRCAIFEDQAWDIVARAERDNPAMEARRWDDDMDDYPPQFKAVVILLIHRAALAWIDEHVPEHFMRPFFANEIPKR